MIFYSSERAYAASFRRKARFGAAAHPPITVPIHCQGKRAVAVVDQVRAISRERLFSKMETVSGEEVLTIGEAVARIPELS